ncbi:hypothetical protein THIOKS13330056 [Thiocapsa sp. KS1]|nr:hypothetical protein THIOKS13330056 [Thiocapsa sp. KS1]
MSNRKAINQRRIRAARPRSAPARPQDIVPVLPFAGLVAADDEVLPARLAGEGLDPVGEGVAAGIVVGGDHDPRPRSHPADGTAEQLRLGGVEAAAGARIAGGVVRVQNGMGERIDTALGDHQSGVGAVCRGEPQALLAAGGKAGEPAVLHLVAAGTLLVGMGKDGVGAKIHLELAGKARAVEKGRRQAPLFEVAVKQQGFHAGEFEQDTGAVAGDSGDLAGEEVGIGPGDMARPAQPRAQLLPHPAERAVPALLHEVDDRAVVEVVLHREVNPMPILGSGDHDLLACPGAHDDGVLRAGSAIEDIVLRRGILREIDECFEVVELFVHVRLPSSA